MIASSSHRASASADSRPSAQFFGVSARDLFDALAHPAVLSSENTMRATPNAAMRAYVGGAWDHRCSWLDLVHADDRPDVESAWRAAVQSGVPVVHAARLRRADGEYRWHDLRGARILPRGGGRPAWLVVASDVDDLRLDAQHKAEFLAYVSHEVATPLTVIWGNARLLRERDALLSDGDRANVLADIEADADRLRRLIVNLLALARADAQRPAQRQRIDLRAVAERVAAHHMRHYPARPLTVRVSPDAGAVLAVESYVEEVLTNYIENAEKYSPDRSAPIEVEAGRCRGELIVRVLDRGVGIDPTEADRLFRAFVRDRATETMAGGSGLGLAVCRWLVQLQGGRVWARPREGGGAEFGFSLPAAHVRRRG